MIAGLDRVPFLERSAELRRFDEALDALHTGAGTFIVIEGEAGIGKSTLLDVGSDAARQAGAQVLRTRAGELERQYGLGVALGLFEPLTRTMSRDDLYDGPAQAARPLFEPGASPAVAGSRDPVATIHGLYWLALNAAERQPLVLTVDDVQWADDASLRFLHYLVQRIDELPILLVVTFRPGEPDGGSEAVHTLVSHRGAVHLPLAALSRTAVGTLLDTIDPSAGHDASGAVWSATRGNPFFVVEVARQGSRADAVPDSVVRVVEARIARLEPTARRIAEAIAILGEEATLRRAARLAGVEDDEAADVARELSRVAVLAPSTPLAFAHPIVRDATYSAVPGVVRARAHRTAALLLLDDGAPAGVVGAMLLEAETAGDARVVEALLEAAAQSVDRGDPALARRLLARALEEPPDPTHRPDVLIALARTEARVQLPTAIGRFQEAVDVEGDASRRASLLLELGHAQISAMDWRAGVETFERGMREMVDLGRPEELSAADRELNERLEAGFVSAAWVGMDRRADAEQTVARILARTTLGRVHRELAMSIAFHRGLAVSASSGELADLVRRAIGEAPIDELITEGQTVEVASGVLLPTDEHDAQIDLLTRAIEAAERAGAYGKVGIYEYCRAWPYYYTGRLADAIADAQASLRVSELGWETFEPAARGVLAEALLEHGQPDAAREAVAIDDARWSERVDYGLIVPLARGRIAMASGDVEGGLALLREAARVPTAIGMRATIPAAWRVWTIVALARLGRRDEAREVAEETVGITREWGARWTLGCALRAAGLAWGGDRGIEMLREAEGLLAGSTARLEHARALVDLGAALRRMGHRRDARTTLARGLDLADRIGARLLLDRAASELRAAGARPRRRALVGRDALTPSEVRVAGLAAAGRTNREIAQTLFVTPKAVEFHLANTYQKLGIASRQDLAGVLQPARPN